MQNQNFDELDNIPDLTIGPVGDPAGKLILLEQDSNGNTDRVAIHPIHLRYIAEKLGLVATSDPTAQKTIATLTRRLLVLRSRIAYLDDWLHTYSDSKHADLSYEQTYAEATTDIADEFCADLDGQAGDALNEPDRLPAPTPLPAHQKADGLNPDKAAGANSTAPAAPQASLI